MIGWKALWRSTSNTNMSNSLATPFHGLTVEWRCSRRCLRRKEAAGPHFRLV